jgi:hypothetical protein
VETARTLQDNTKERRRIPRLDQGAAREAWEEMGFSVAGIPMTSRTAVLLNRRTGAHRFVVGSKRGRLSRGRSRTAVLQVGGDRSDNPVSHLRGRMGNRFGHRPNAGVQAFAPVLRYWTRSSFDQLPMPLCGSAVMLGANQPCSVAPEKGALFLSPPRRVFGV